MVWVEYYISYVTACSPEIIETKIREKKIMTPTHTTHEDTNVQLHTVYTHMKPTDSLIIRILILTSGMNDKSSSFDRL